MNLRIISAGAGSGKTYRLTEELTGLIQSGVSPEGVIATTFTRKAAEELKERVRQKLLGEGLSKEADALANALIGTVHSLGVKLLQRFAYETGHSPRVDIMADEDQQTLFNQSIATILTLDRVREMEQLCLRLGLSGDEPYDWRAEVRKLTEVARVNDLDPARMADSRQRSIDSLLQLFGPEGRETLPELQAQLKTALETGLAILQAGEDHTKATQATISRIKASLREMSLRDELPWHYWIKLVKLKPGAKSRETVAPIQEIATRHEACAAFRADVSRFIAQVFELAQAAMAEYQRYKSERGLIDYTDMEVQVLRLLDHPRVQQSLQQELEVLLVDEFQDTSPIQLAIFLRLSALAQQSIWVGDPKQSIYGFRGASPSLMQAIIDQVGIRDGDIQEWSWRSREDIVHACNALFCQAFSDLPPERVALRPKRQKLTSDTSINTSNEPLEAELAIGHWQMQQAEKFRLSKSWFAQAIAHSLRQWLQDPPPILPKGENNYRPARAGDVAILCRTNKDCQLLAEALHQAGIAAAISRKGLTATTEARFLIACLRYLLQGEDSLSVAELLVLGEGIPTAQMLENRLDYLKEREQHGHTRSWAIEYPLIAALYRMRLRILELTSVEILDMVLDELDLRRMMAAWGQAEQRLANVAAFRKLARQYENNCSRLQVAASLGGFLLWLNEVARAEEDQQGASENLQSVNVLTYHKSKGLEWPIVIGFNLDSKLRTNVWGVQPQPVAEQIDLQNVLSNNWVRYWINPYGRSVNGTPLMERLERSDAYTHAREAAQAEENRLLYVGLTRARDQLIFPDLPGGKGLAWVNRAFHDGRDDQPVFDEDLSETPWSWDGYLVPKKTEVFSYEKAFPSYPVSGTTADFWPPRQGKEATYRPASLDLRKQQLDQAYQLHIPSPTAYAKALNLDGINRTILAKAVKNSLNAIRLTDELAVLQEQADAQIARQAELEGVDPTGWVALLQQWQAWLTHHFPQHDFIHQMPVQYDWKGQQFRTVVDLVVIGPTDINIIQYSSTAGTTKQWKQKAQELGDWFFLVQLALQKTYPSLSCKCYLNAVLGGGLAELVFEN